MLQKRLHEVSLRERVISIVGGYPYIPSGFTIFVEFKSYIYPLNRWFMSSLCVDMIIFAEAVDNTERHVLEGFVVRHVAQNPQYTAHMIVAL